MDGLSTGRAVAVTVAVVATLVVLAASLQRRRRKRMPMDVGQQQPPVLSEEQVQQFLHTTAHESKALKALFDKIDTDHSGTISKEEFLAEFDPEYVKPVC